MSVEKQGHDNRTYRLGNDMLIRMPTAESYALKVPKEQALLPKLEPHLTVNIPAPIKMGTPSKDYLYPFSIHQWLEGKSIDLIQLLFPHMTAIRLSLSISSLCICENVFNRS